MSNFGPVCLALIFTITGFSLFGNCYTSAYLHCNAPAHFCTTLIFNLGIFALLTSSDTMSICFRKPPLVLLWIYEFISSLFILEFARNCIWFPIENAILLFFPQWLANSLDKGSNKCSDVTATKFTPETILYWQILCYILSIFFLATVLHCTRVWDLRCVIRNIQKLAQQCDECDCDPFENCSDFSD